MARILEITGVNEGSRMPTMDAEQATLLDISRSRAGRPFLRQPIFNSVANDKYTKLKCSIMKVINISLQIIMTLVTQNKVPKI